MTKRLIKMVRRGIKITAGSVKMRAVRVRAVSEKRSSSILSFYRASVTHIAYRYDYPAKKGLPEEVYEGQLALIQEIAWQEHGPCSCKCLKSGL
jgi:hypothetical protein